MATTTRPITVAEFEKIEDPEGGKYQLQDGELVFVAYPRLGHEKRMMAAAFELARHLAKTGFIGAAFPFRVTPEYNEWACDVAYVRNERLNVIPEGELLIGAPDLVIEVLSPSNRNLKMNRREALCLANGCRQFWLVDLELKIVKVTTPDRKTITYGIGDAIDLAEFGGGTIAVETLFR